MCPAVKRRRYIPAAFFALVYYFLFQNEQPIWECVRVDTIYSKINIMKNKSDRGAGCTMQFEFLRNAQIYFIYLDTNMWSMDGKLQGARYEKEFILKNYFSVYDAGAIHRNWKTRQWFPIQVKFY